MSDYSAQWRHYRFLTRAGIAALVLFVGSLPLAILLDHYRVPLAVSHAVFTAMACIGLLSLGVCVLLISYWPCPRCRERFTSRAIGLGWDSLGRRCVHCGLKLYEGYRQVGRELE